MSRCESSSTFEGLTVPIFRVLPMTWCPAVPQQRGWLHFKPNMAVMISVLKQFAQASLTRLVCTPSQAHDGQRDVYQTSGYQVIGSSLNMQVESVPKKLEYFHTLMHLSAQDDFIEFCHCKSCKTYSRAMKLKISVYG
jgi:hypothetical protein